MPDGSWPVEESDEATLDVLRRIVSRPDALQVPLVLAFRTPEPLDAAGALVAALRESRRVFEEKAATDPVALIEIAETDHLFARIPLHVAARPGREGDALSMGLDHAPAAERTYKKLGAVRELGRVWETMGRLELRKGRIERATQRLSAAIEAQQATGDLVGLARSTAALSEALSAEGRHRDALGVRPRPRWLQVCEVATLQLPSACVPHQPTGHR